MNLFVLGINHEKTPIEIREKLAFSQSKILCDMEKLKVMGLNEFIFLSTCNRSEIYFLAKNQSTLGKVKEYYIEESGEDITKYIFVKSGKDFISYIYGVTSGLNSAIFGEDEILGQVKKTLNFSIESGTSGKILNKIFREAITFSKKIRSHYRISENQTSIGAISVNFAMKKLNGLESKKILVIGSGEVGILTIKYLKNIKNCHIYLANRTKENAMKIIDDNKSIELIDYKDRYKDINEFDVVITATSSPHIIFEYDKLLTLLKRKILFMDLAVPRDVDSRIGEINGVSLYTVDDIKKISENNIEKRKEIAEDIYKEIDFEVDLIDNWIRKSKVDGFIRDINNAGLSSINEIKNEIEAMFKPENRDKKKIDKVIESSVKKIFKDAIINLKKLDDENEIANYGVMLSKIFDLGEEI